MMKTNTEKEAIYQQERFRKQDAMRNKLNKQLDKFCKDYEVQILHENRCHRRVRYVVPEFFNYSDDASIINSKEMIQQTESLYTLSIPESRLRALLEMEERVFRFSNERGNKELFEVLMDKEREEAYYRTTNEGIEKAYEQYSMLLYLAGYQKKF